MKKFLLLIFISILLQACAFRQLYYSKSSLNYISIGQTKEEIFKIFPKGESKAIDTIGTPPIQLRAAQKNNGKLIEVAEVFLSNINYNPIPYWFIFENGILVQYGQPSDWKEVKDRYEIIYNPSFGVSY